MKWEDLLKKDLTDEQQKKLKEVEEEIRDSFSTIDLSTINMIFVPHGRGQYSSKEEFINNTINKVIESMKKGFDTE